jgi:hypothetical protein
MRGDADAAQGSRPAVPRARNDSTAQIRRMLGLRSSGQLPDLEMVLRVSEQNEIGDSVELVACRKVTQHTE